MSRVAVVGAGYVGLTTAACLAHLGHDVVCADVDSERVERLRKGDLPILEERLPVLVAEGVETRRLDFVVGAAHAVQGAHVVFLCLPTPEADDGGADISALEAVAREIAPELEPDTVVVTKSTAPVGTTRLLERLIDERGGETKRVRVVCNPEFLREGTAVRDFLRPDRIVIGCDDPAVAVKIADLYRGILAPTVVTDPASAEMIKYAANGYLAARISYINAIATLCEATGADVRDVVLGLGYDARIGSEYLAPGPGFGGSCLPKDVSALLHTARAHGCDLPPLRAAVEVNTVQRERVVGKVRDALGEPWEDARVAVWGLTFKANTDDLRHSPALEIAGALTEMGARVRAYDPVAGERAAAVLPKLDISLCPYDACEAADVLVVLTEWEEFRWVDFGRIREALRHPRIVDARNLLDGARLRQMGFSYQGVGR